MIKLQTAIDRINSCTNIINLENALTSTTDNVRKDVQIKLVDVFFARWVEVTKAEKVTHDLDLEFLGKERTNNTYKPAFADLRNFVNVIHSKQLKGNITYISNGHYANLMYTKLKGGRYIELNGNLYYYDNRQTDIVSFIVPYKDEIIDVGKVDTNNLFTFKGNNYYKFQFIDKLVYFDKKYLDNSKDCNVFIYGYNKPAIINKNNKPFKDKFSIVMPMYPEYFTEQT